MTLARTTVSEPQIEVGFAYPGNHMGGYRDDRVREQTAALGRVVQVC